MRAAGGKVEWSESFKRAAEKIVITDQAYLAKGDEGWRITINEYLYDYVLVTDEDAARGLLLALKARIGQGIDRDGVLAMPVPMGKAVCDDYATVLDLYAGTDHQQGIEVEVDRIDRIVGPALGLSAQDIADIREDMMTDPFLKIIQPRWPGTATRLHGYRTGLDSADRYA